MVVWFGGRTVEVYPLEMDQPTETQVIKILIGDWSKKEARWNFYNTESQFVTEASH